MSTPQASKQSSNASSSVFFGLGDSGGLFGNWVELLDSKFENSLIILYSFGDKEQKYFHTKKHVSYRIIQFSTNNKKNHNFNASLVGSGL